LYSLLHPCVASSILGPNILLSTLFSNTLSLCSSLSVREIVPQLFEKIHRILWSLNVHNRVHKIPPLFRIMSQINLTDEI
jgi:hypothetical protein